MIKTSAISHINDFEFVNTAKRCCNAREHRLRHFRNRIPASVEQQRQPVEYQDELCIRGHFCKRCCKLACSFCFRKERLLFLRGLPFRKCKQSSSCLSGFTFTKKRVCVFSSFSFFHQLLHFCFGLKDLLLLGCVGLNDPTLPLCFSLLHYGCLKLFLLSLSFLFLHFDLCFTFGSISFRLLHPQGLLLICQRNVKRLV